MAFIRAKANTALALKQLKILRRAVSPEVLDQHVIRKVAWIWHARMVQRTPKRWTGQTRRGWRVDHPAPYRYTVTNGEKVMRFLERGTQAHGPKNAKRLFIPLTRRAMLAGPRVIMADLLYHRANREQGWSSRLKYKPGVDYVWAKWVRGIKAHRIVEQAKPFMQSTLRAALRQFILAVINRPS